MLPSLAILVWLLVWIECWNDVIILFFFKEEVFCVDCSFSGSLVVGVLK